MIYFCFNVLLRFQLNESQRNACQRFQALMDNTGDLRKIINQLELSDLNHVLFKCDQEDRDTGGGGVYCLDGYGPLKYAGLQGKYTFLKQYYMCTFSTYLNISRSHVYFV